MTIKTLGLFTNDLAATKRFYTECMQLRLVDETAAQVSFAAGNSLLKFTKITGSNPFYHFAFSIPNNHLQNALIWVSRFAEILPYSSTEQIADFTGWNAKAFYFHDNNNNILELITHYDLAIETADVFSSASVLSICEAGIVVDEVAAATKHIYETYGVPYFLKGPNLTDFSVMGDAHGMFIVSKKGRGWLPTHRACAYYPLNVIAEEKGGEFEIAF